MRQQAQRNHKAQHAPYINLYKYIQSKREREREVEGETERGLVA